MIRHIIPLVDQLASSLFESVTRRVAHEEVHNTHGLVECQSYHSSK